ncbi:DUF4349 domain-containing protein [Pedobacter sp. N36a]|uniref:DUF4349 domain-containing protein n=1 Tax=Pedobacter sp. N36a TaxID=2767996 RepID=UPI001656E080|nr:DUF4349 domain-containing protein [Pedobacter sp. N36a]MBC8985648.1 DUF4349 domain-containing protein [Pedobacter sp. N36a]
MKRHVVYGLAVLLFAACSQDKKSHEPDADATSNELMITDSSSAPKIIKTADMRFRVKDVQQAKEKLGNLIKAEGGTLAEFSIHSDVYQSEKVRYSTDSLLELTSYRTEGSIVAKVPADKLDDFTNKVAGMAVFVDQQSMKFDDLSLSYLSNQLKNQNRIAAVSQLNKHANKKSNPVETALELKDTYVDQKLENMRINDRVQYSDITLAFYQDNTVKKLVVGNDHLSDYRPSFLRRLGLNIQNGWVIFMEFLLILANLWMLILVAAVAFIAFKQYRKRNRKATI